MNQEDAWEALLALVHGPEPVPALEGELWELFGPLLPVPAARPLVVAHLAQSLDGCIATADGDSQWISGEADLLHTHRLRAFVDAVVVGARTVEADDPRLNLRRCTGPDPLRVVLDPNARLTGPLRVLQGQGSIVFSGVDAPCPVERVVLDPVDGILPPAAVLAELARRGVRRVLVEGGGVTVGRFLQAGLVDRLHLTIAPVLIGGGRRAFPLPLAEVLRACPRPAWRRVCLGEDQLWDLDLRASA